MIEWLAGFVGILGCGFVTAVMVYAAVNEGIVPALRRWWDTLKTLVIRVIQGPKRKFELQHEREKCAFYKKQAELDMEIWGELSQDTKDHLRECKHYLRHPINLRPVPKAPEVDTDNVWKGKEIRQGARVYITSDRCPATGDAHQFELQGVCSHCDQWLLPTPPRGRGAGSPVLSDPGRVERR